MLIKLQISRNIHNNSLINGLTFNDDQLQVSIKTFSQRITRVNNNFGASLFNIMHWFTIE